ncbi:hypothetical protein [Marinifilum caeruleilacunae]|uniref:Uncharacterized protein n=1 Tax=Marinifilum caeruleilacunae TaxID=2499076 RepID=A0ABX1WXI5_9BACT|nr:hypothetical protein [Marinifilum caeruleilacunae]NOU60822.1 hypothetical protein [Marinifilum caeruleilacunae]
MVGNKVQIIDVSFDKIDWVFTMSISVIALAISVLLIIVGYQIFKYLFNWKKNNVQNEIVPVKLKYKLGNAEIEYEVKRSYQNIEIAHKIYIELITRKAAIEIDKDKDVIVEVYNSWYSLFQVTREELKQLSGNLLLVNDSSESLIKLLSDVLNIGLRPHLTEYQAKFRKWYQEKLLEDESNGRSPQQIQKDYDDYNNLINSMKDVNRLLIDYAKELKKIIKGKE